MTPALSLAIAIFLNVPIGGPNAQPTIALFEAIAASPSPAVNPPVVSNWLGVSLGEAPAEIRTQLGKPREIVSSSVGDVWRYDADKGNATLELVFSNDQVVNIALRSKTGRQSSMGDPFGGALGMSAQALQATRGTPIATYDDGASVAYGEAAGVRWFYRVDGGVVTSIEVSKPLPPPSPIPQIAPDSYRDGSTIEKALVVKAVKETDSTNAVLSFLRTQTCGGTGIWKIVNEELVSFAARFYEQYHVTCTTTGNAREFFFDVTDSYGK